MAVVAATAAVPAIAVAASQSGGPQERLRAGAPALQAPADAGDEWVPGEAIVRFEPATGPGPRAAARAGADVAFGRSLRVPRAQLVEVEGDVEAAVRRLERQPGVAYAQPNYRYRVSTAPAGWTTTGVNGGVLWGSSTRAASGNRSAADSPNGNYGNADDPDFWAESRLVRSSPVSLVGQRGCRMHFSLQHELENGFDFLEVGAVLPGGLATLEPREHWYTGSTGGSFVRKEVSISPHDGQPQVRPWFALLSDETVTADGAYLDDVRLICRDQTYVDAIAPLAQYDQPGSGNYVHFQGTSMATPHVAGVAALVRAADPTASNDEVIDAIEAGGAPLASLATTTATGCTADAAGAIAVVLGHQTGPCAASAPPASPAPPNDSFFGALWGLAAPSLPDPGVNALGAWETTRGDGRVIAVVDTGVDLTHPDLVDRLWVNPAPDPVKQDVHGYDFVDDDGDPDDYHFHGTHVAGTAAATAGNGLGIAGVAPEARIMAIRALDGNGGGSSSDIGEGIAYAAENGADVINLSLGGSGATDSHMSAAIAVADTFDAVVVAAAGNDGTNNDIHPTVPCTLPHANLVCVAAVTRSGARAAFSNYGATTVDVGAPGTAILSAKADYGAPLLSDGFDVAEPAPPPPTPPAAPPPPTPLPQPAPAPLARPDLSGAPGRIRLRGARTSYAFRAPAGTLGRAVLRTRARALVPTRRGVRRRHLTLARQSFTTGRDGRVVLRVRLTRSQLRILRVNRRLRLVVRVSVRDGRGRSATAAKRLVLIAPAARRR